MWENTGAELPILKWEISPSLRILGNAKIIPFVVTRKKKKHILSSGRLSQDREAENKFQEELLNPALLLHRFLVV